MRARQRVVCAVWVLLLSYVRSFRITSSIGMRKRAEIFQLIGERLANDVEQNAEILQQRTGYDE